MRTDTSRVGISGSCGGLNLGDEGILEAIIRQLRASLAAAITVFMRDTEDTLRRHRVEHAVPVRGMTRDEARAEREKFELLILGGGGILYDRHVELYLREVALAHEVGMRLHFLIFSALQGVPFVASGREPRLPRRGDTQR